MFTKKGVVKFIPHESRLHYLDLEDQHESRVALVTTIRENFEGYTKYEVEGATRACWVIHPRRILKEWYMLT